MLNKAEFNICMARKTHVFGLVFGSLVSIMIAIEM